MLRRGRARTLRRRRSPPVRVAPSSPEDLWITALVVLGVSSLLGSINYVTAIINIRAPGMTLVRLPLVALGTSAAGDCRAEPEQIVGLKTRDAQGQMVPLGSIVTRQWRNAPDRIVRYNMFLTADVNGDAAPSASQGRAMAVMERLATDLPLE